MNLSLKNSALLKMYMYVHAFRHDHWQCVSSSSWEVSSTWEASNQDDLGTTFSWLPMFWFSLVFVRLVHYPLFFVFCVFFF